MGIPNLLPNYLARQQNRYTSELIFSSGTVSPPSPLPPSLNRLPPPPPPGYRNDNLMIQFGSFTPQQFSTTTFNHGKGIIKMTTLFAVVGFSSTLQTPLRHNVYLLSMSLSLSFSQPFFFLFVRIEALPISAFFSLYRRQKLCLNQLVGGVGGGVGCSKFQRPTAENVFFFACFCTILLNYRQSTGSTTVAPFHVIGFFSVPGSSPEKLLLFNVFTNETILYVLLFKIVFILFYF